MIIFYDGRCPLCAKEMDHLKQHDHHNQIVLKNVHCENFASEYPEINKQHALNVLHGYDFQGKLIKGLDVTVLAWQTVGKHRWLGILRWPLIRTISDLCYLFFAKHRMTISKLLVANQCQGEKSCDRK
ncbi:thiol-disulfide oxidoreductase DCC family protein (plasmid) [Pseudoalteromonas sp. T1lg65]|uniref:thiol-disulfide oxidoreductase DCC family protein n=1 Tax=Pseudoalteromonas sp. T1lg65 TaxID=2077101 RepID=UPI003F79078E